MIARGGCGEEEKSLIFSLTEERSVFKANIQETTDRSM